MTLKKLALAALFGAWLLHAGTALKATFAHPRLEAQLQLSQRLGLAGLYADGLFESARPALQRLAFMVESDPSRRAILEAHGGRLSSTADLPLGYRQAADYQRQPTPERLLNLKIAAFQGLQRLGISTLLVLGWLVVAVALAVHPRTPPDLDKPSLKNISLPSGLAVFLLWALLVPYGLTPLVRRLLAESGTWVGFWMLQILSALLLLGLLWAARGSQRMPFPLWKLARGREVGQGLLLCGLAILGIELFISSTTGVSPFARNPTLAILLRADGLNLLGFVILAVVVGPFLEELLFRGWLLPGLLTSLSQGQALVASSALFALSHGSFWNAPGQFAGGLILGWTVLRTGSITSSVVIHGGWNLFWLIRVCAAGP